MKTKPALRRDPRKLTTRELQIVKAIADGLDTREIAARLGISESTVETHRANIFRKLGMLRSTQVVRWALQEGLA